RRGAAARDELDAELVEAARELVESGLVEDGDERALDHHRERRASARNPRTASGSSRCSTAWMRACRVSGVSPGSIATVSWAITGPESMPSSTMWIVTPVRSRPDA